MNPLSDSPPTADEALQPLKAGDERFIAALRASHGAKENPRRNVIDKLPWTAFCWNEGVIRIQATEFFRPNSHESEGEVLVDPDLLELFRSFYACRKSEFVIESKQHPKHTATFGHYRCHAVPTCQAERSHSSRSENK